MKTRLLIIIGIGIIGLLVATNPQYVDGLCMENQDWPDAPCYGKRCGDSDAPACTDPNWWQEKWSPYYDHKGSEWMEMKKIELLDAIESNNFEEWRRLTLDSSNGNVFNYYFYMGEIPNTDGMFVDQIFTKSLFPYDTYSDDESLRLESEQETMGYEQLNYRLTTDSEFLQLLQTEVVGFGVDEQNEGIFIVVDPMYANQENFDKYEEIFRVTIGEDVPIKFEVRERADSIDKEDPDFFIFLVIIFILVFSAVIIYFWRKRK